MPYIDPEVILEAKKMDLFTYLQNYEPQKLVHFSGNVYCTRTHDSLKISNGKWCWHSRGIGGRSALGTSSKPSVKEELREIKAAQQKKETAYSTPNCFNSYFTAPTISTAGRCPFTSIS